MAAGTRAEEIRERLTAISEELADLAIDRLRFAVEAADDGERAAAAAEEKRLTRARRAVDKAVSVLDA